MSNGAAAAVSSDAPTPRSKSLADQYTDRGHSESSRYKLIRKAALPPVANPRAPVTMDGKLW